MLLLNKLDPISKLRIEKIILHEIYKPIYNKVLTQYSTKIFEPCQICFQHEQHNNYFYFLETSDFEKTDFKFCRNCIQKVIKSGEKKMFRYLDYLLTIQKNYVYNDDLEMSEYVEFDLHFIRDIILNDEIKQWKHLIYKNDILNQL
jgi:hypothetical protein